VALASVQDDFGTPLWEKNNRSVEPFVNVNRGLQRAALFPGMFSELYDEMTGGLAGLNAQVAPKPTVKIKAWPLPPPGPQK
jgi:hypothetical protein